MLINKAYILENVLENPDEFRKYFITCINEIDQVVKKPKCSICINTLLKKLLALQDFHQKLTLVMNEPNLEFAQDIRDFVYSGESKNAIRSKTKIEVFFVDLENAKEFIEKYCSGKLIRSIQTTFIPDDRRGQIMVTVHWSTIE